MCGIAGYFGSSFFEPRNRNIQNTLSLMRNRGRDGNGFEKFQINKQKKLNFLHTRLSIIDPNKRSNQPFRDEDGILIFNGMIYNYIQIREDLIKKKINFKTKSDTEVLLKFLNTYGPKNLDLLDGMWSFAYYNFKKKNFI